MSLPLSWIEKLFERLYVTYGAAWARMWEGVPMDDVKANWAYELAGFARHPNAIAYALENLPAERPPTALVFRQICRLAPEPEVKRLPPPPKDPEKARAAREAFREALRAKTEPAQGKAAFAWAYGLQERERSGEPLTETQRRAWRDALAEAPLGQIIGEFKAPPRECLPPGMREAA
jgi:hypothetical protein